MEHTCLKIVLISDESECTVNQRVYCTSVLLALIKCTIILRSAV